MGIIDFNPVDWGESIADGSLRRTEIRKGLSALYSAQITELWELGKRLPWGFGKAQQRTATALYLSVSANLGDGLTLTVPKDLLDADNLAQFETIAKK